MPNPKLTGQIQIQNAVEYESALAAVERLMEVAEDSSDDPLDPLIDMLADAIQAWEADLDASEYLLASPKNRQRLEQAIAQFEAKTIPISPQFKQQIEQFLSVIEVVKQDAPRPWENEAKTIALLQLMQLMQVSERSGVTLSFLEAFECQKLLARVRPWFGNETGALRWYLNQRLPALGYLTPAEVVKQHGEKGLNALLEYVQAKELGGFE